MFLASACSNQDDALQCSFHVVVPTYHCSRNPSAQATGRKKSPQDTLSQQKLPTSFSKLLSSSAAQEEQLQLFLEDKTCSSSLRRHRMPRPGSAALNRTETSSTTQSSGAAGLCNTIAPSQHVLSLLEHKAGLPEKLLTLVFSNFLIAFFRELNGPQCPSSETCTLTWVLLIPAHRQGNERSGFDPATDAFGSLLSHAAGSTPYSSSAFQAVTGVCTGPHPHTHRALQPNLLSPGNQDSTKKFRLSFSETI